eukprot:14167101-Alexandrium_andersonii.AAC.1
MRLHLCHLCKGATGKLHLGTSTVMPITPKGALQAPQQYGVYTFTDDVKHDLCKMCYEINELVRFTRMNGRDLDDAERSDVAKSAR